MGYISEQEKGREENEKTMAGTYFGLFIFMSFAFLTGLVVGYYGKSYQISQYCKYNADASGTITGMVCYLPK